MSVETAPSRRRFMQASGALGLAAALPGVVRAQGAPLQLGVLTPLTGAGDSTVRGWPRRCRR